MVSVAGGLALTGLRPIVHIVRAVPGRARLGAGQARLRPPGRRRGARQRRRLVRRIRVRADPLQPAATWRCSTRSTAGPSTCPVTRPRSGRCCAGRRRTTDPSTSDCPVGPTPGPDRRRRGTDGRLVPVRRGTGGVVVAVGPMLDPVVAATEGLDVTVAYTHTPRPFDADGLRELVWHVRRPTAAAPASCWSSRTWPAPRPASSRRRWPTRRTGSSGSASVGPTCTGTARRPTTTPPTVWTRPACARPSPPTSTRRREPTLTCR